MNRKSHDVVVIGGGIIGMSVAYFLARKGCDVCVVEKSVPGQESSGRCAGNLTRSHRPAPDLPIAMRAVELYKQLSDESDLDFEYNPQGNLRLAWNEKHATDLMNMVERDSQAGLECRFLDRADTRAMAPYAAGPYLGSVYTPGDGSAEPYLACVAVTRGARRFGATIHQHREVTGIEVSNGEISSVKTATGPIHTHVVVNAAGAWSPAVGAMTGVRIPAVVKRSHLVVTEKLPKFIEPVLSTDFYGYFRQTRSGNVIIGYAATPVEGYERRVTYEALNMVGRRTATIIPRLRNASVIRAFTGFTMWTEDYLPIIGPVKAVRGLYIASAFCGLGFGVGPAVGELMAELVMHGKTSLPIDAFSLNRFQNRTT